MQKSSEPYRSEYPSCGDLYYLVSHIQEDNKAKVGGSLTFGQARISTNECSLTRAVHEPKEDAESVHAGDGLDANPAVYHDAECSHPNKECVYRSQDIVSQVTHYRPCRNTHCVHNQ